ncbi:MAG TPA: hypothetical protein VH062_05100 [Polyangiaceae bacterium]|jgi:hypothetical protein|nr:hypothetical protein [Polyangiaceae bacterium]
MTKLVPMGVGDILDTAFRLFRKRFLTFIGIATVVCVPSSIVAAVLMGAMRAFAPLQQPDDDDGLLNVVLSSPLSPRSFVRAFTAFQSLPQIPNLQNLGGSLLALAASVMMIVLAGFFVFSVAYPLCTGALVVNISTSYLGENIGAGESYLRAFKKLWRLLMAQAWTTILVMLGFVLCIIPGLILSLQLVVVPQVVLLEDLKAWPAIKRSRTLMADYLGKVAMLTSVVWLLGLVIGAAITAAIHVVPWPYPIIGDFLSYFLLQVLMMPLSIATTVLFYYDLRIRKEAFDLQHLASSMVEFRGAPPPPV